MELTKAKECQFEDSPSELRGSKEGQELDFAYPLGFTVEEARALD